MSELRLETPPLEVVGARLADDASAKALALLMASPEVEVIGRMLCNIERKRLGLNSVLRLDTLEPEATRYYREHAVMAIRLLDTEHADAAIDSAALVYAMKTYGLTPDSLSDNRRVFCAQAARAICNAFKHSLSGR